HRLGAVVHFYPRYDSLILQCFHESASIARLLPNRLVEENYAADKFTRASCSKYDFTIRPSIFLCGRNTDAFQPLLDRPRALIRCEDPLSRGDKFSCYRFQGLSTHNSLLANKIITFFLAKCSVKCK